MIYMYKNLYTRNLFREDRDRQKDKWLETSLSAYHIYIQIRSHMLQFSFLQRRKK